jgi:hypothetical protein
MIIGINGKIGSGKDTVGSIIQYLTDKNVKGMSFEDWYASNVYSVYQATGKWEIKKFAGKLKEIASLLTGVDVEKFEDQEFKKLNMPEYWNRLQQSGRSKVWVPMTYRKFLQELGTEVMRNGLHTNVWVNALFADYKAEESWLNVQLSEKPELVYPNWIITDMRFPNEMEAVVEKGGITIRVVRDYALRGGPEDPKNIHPSETALDGHIMHYEIINDGTIEDLIEKVKEILIKEDII